MLFRSSIRDFIGTSSYNNTLTLSGNLTVPYTSGTLQSGNTIVIGAGFFNGSGSTSDVLGTLSFTNVTWNVTLG